MDVGTAGDPVDPALLGAWLRGRSTARGLPAPVADHGGWRVDTGMREEHARYVFAVPCPGLQALARRIDSPGIPLKLCATPGTLRALLPDAWVVQPQAWLMTGPHGGAPAAALPSGYRLEVERSAALAARIVAADGTIAASGYAAAADGCHIYDRIVTAPAHRRRGLGRALMAALAAEAPAETHHLLAATAEGRSLYRTLGWRDRAPYSTASIPPA